MALDRSRDAAANPVTSRPVIVPFYDENDPDACLDLQFVVDALVDSRQFNGRDESCFSSRHPGGAHFLFADGTVKFLSEKCSTTIMRRLANRDDGATVEAADSLTFQ